MPICVSFFGLKTLGTRFMYCPMKSALRRRGKNLIKVSVLGNLINYDLKFYNTITGSEMWCVTMHRYITGVIGRASLSQTQELWCSWMSPVFSSALKSTIRTNSFVVIFKLPCCCIFMCSWLKGRSFHYVPLIRRNIFTIVWGRRDWRKWKSELIIGAASS